MVMFEIYRDSQGASNYRAAYFTELAEHERDAEISRAMNGESFLGGFLRDDTLRTAKQIIANIVAHLNRGDSLLPDDVRHQLRDHLAA